MIKVAQSIAAALVALVAFLFAISVPARYLQLATVLPEAQTFVGQLEPADASVLSAMGVTVEAYALYFTILEVAAGAIYLGMAVLILWGRPRELIAIYTALLLAAFALILPVVSAHPATQAFWNWVVHVGRVAGGVLLVPFPMLFPDGRFVPRRMRWLALLWLGYTATWLVLPDWQPPFAFGEMLTRQQLLNLSLLFVFFLAGVLAQLYRYRYDATNVQRQQTKWITAGFLALFLFALAGIAVLLMTANNGELAMRLAGRWLGPTLVILGTVCVPITIGVSVLRLHLWDIDLIVRRTLIYAVLTTVLLIVFMVTVTLLQGVFTTLSGQRSSIAVVVSTLVIAALFNPLRQRVQQGIDRRFYRRRYDAALVLAQFIQVAQHETDVHRLTAALEHTVKETMQPQTVSLWFADEKSQRLP